MIWFDICMQKKEPYIICWKWASIPAAVSKTDKTWTFKWLLFCIWFGLHGLDLPLQCTEFCCLHMESGYECFQASKESSPNAWSVNIIISPVLGMYTSLGCLDAICSCLGSTESKRVLCLQQAMKERQYFVTMPLKHHSYICIDW